MNIFLTGATGFIGSAVARAAIAGGHHVTGLVRADTSDSAAALAQVGVALHVGDLGRPESFATAAGAAEAVIHAASTNDAGAPAADEAAATAMLAAMPAKSVFLYTSGVWVYGDTGGATVTEASALNPTPLVAWRVAVEKKVLAVAAERGIAATVLRPGMVHGGADRGVFGMFSGMARPSGVVKLVGDGRNHWPTVQVDDLAAAYIAAVERARAGDAAVVGQSINVVTEPAVAVSAIGEALRAAIGAERLEFWPVAEARQALGPFADALAMDQHVSGELARKALGWTPTRPTVLADLAG